MAQALTDIYNSLIAQKQTMTALNGLQPSVDNAQTLLANLTSASKVAVWRLILFIVAVALWTQQNLWDAFQVQLQAIVNSAIPGTTRWYQEQALAFQLGYALTWLNGKYQYTDTTSPAAITAQIVKRAACVEASGAVVVKAAKLVGGVVTPLSLSEFAAFNAYMQQINFAGVNLSDVSFAPDYLKIAYTVYYDPLVLASDGTLLSDGVTKPVEVTINNYIANLPFNGLLRLSSLDNLLDVLAENQQGVIDFERTLAQAKYGANPYADIVVSYSSNAGYLIIDPAFPLATQITYIPNV